jgi:hypothetical protein
MPFEYNFNISPISMIKWFAYIVVLLIFAPCLSSAKIKNHHFNAFSDSLGLSLPLKQLAGDTSTTKNNKKQDQDDKKKIKEVAKTKKQPKPEKVEPANNTAAAQSKPKPKRQRRPEGLERPPEIPRRNGN